MDIREANHLGRGRIHKTGNLIIDNYRIFSHDWNEFRENMDHLETEARQYESKMEPYNYTFVYSDGFQKCMLYEDREDWNKKCRGEDLSLYRIQTVQDYQEMVKQLPKSFLKNKKPLVSVNVFNEVIWGRDFLTQALTVNETANNTDDKYFPMGHFTAKGKVAGGVGKWGSAFCCFQPPLSQANESRILLEQTIRSIKNSLDLFDVMK